MSILLPLASVVAGLGLLIWSADRFIEGAIATAHRYRLPPMVIGLTLVAFATSAPEMLVAAVAAFTGAGVLALGNVLGSNIANIGLILGLTALIAPLPLLKSSLRLDLPLLLAVTLLTWPLFMDGHLGPMDGLILCIIMIGSFFLLIRYSNTATALASEVQSTPAFTLPQTLWVLGSGLAVLLLSSRMLVWGAVEMATAFGISELVIGLTLVAIGTSLPELAASVTSAIKGQHGMVLGNIIGSNFFNLLLVLAIPAFIGGAIVDDEALYRDFSAMLILTIMLLAFAWLGRRKQRLSRLEGGILLAGYVVYSLVIFLSTAAAR